MERVLHPHRCQWALPDWRLLLPKGPAELHGEFGEAQREHLSAMQVAMTKLARARKRDREIRDTCPHPSIQRESNEIQDS